MSCPCSQDTGPVLCQSGAKRDALTVTRAIMCAGCPHKVSIKSPFADAGNCGLSGNPTESHILYATPCPAGRHPNKHNIVTITVSTHGAPYWIRVRLLLTRAISLSGFRNTPGCGCIVRLKRRVRQLRTPRLWGPFLRKVAAYYTA